MNGRRSRCKERVCSEGRRRGFRRKEGPLPQAGHEPKRWGGHGSLHLLTLIILIMIIATTYGAPHHVPNTFHR